MNLGFTLICCLSLAAFFCSSLQPKSDSVKSRSVSSLFLEPSSEYKCENYHILSTSVVQRDGTLAQWPTMRSRQYSWPWKNGKPALNSTGMPLSIAMTVPSRQYHVTSIIVPVPSYSVDPPAGSARMVWAVQMIREHRGITQPLHFIQRDNKREREEFFIAVTSDNALNRLQKSKSQSAAVRCCEKM